MWEHAKRVTSVIFSDPSVGNCELHGIENHICRMYTASEDRLIRIWDMEIHLPVRTIRTKMSDPLLLLLSCVCVCVCG
jgi:hypothetical protein